MYLMISAFSSVTNPPPPLASIIFEAFAAVIWYRRGTWKTKTV